jgi:hypothetical protein
VILQSSEFKLQRDLQKGWHGHLARDSWPGFAIRTAVFHGQDARATTSARGSSVCLFHFSSEFDSAFFGEAIHGALHHPKMGEKFVVPTSVGLFKNPPKGGTTNLFS